MNTSINRISMMIKRDLIIHRKLIIISSISLFVIAGFMMFITSDGDNSSNQVPPDAGEIVYGVLIILCGFIFTASIYHENKNDQKHTQFLAEPTSNLEKIFVKWLYTLPLYILYISVIFIISYLFYSRFLGNILNVVYVPLSELKSKYYMYILNIYMIVHAVTFLSSIVFKKYKIPKIITLILFITIIANLIVVISARIIFREYIDSYSISITPANMKDITLSSDFIDGAELWLGRLPYLLTLVAVPYLWLITYYKMKEKQI